VGRQERGKWGSDGYRELEVRQQAAKRDAKPIRHVDLRKLKDEEYKNKKISQRASKYIHPKGAGKPKGDFS